MPSDASGIQAPFRDPFPCSGPEAAKGLLFLGVAFGVYTWLTGLWCSSPLPPPICSDRLGVALGVARGVPSSALAIPELLLPGRIWPRAVMKGSVPRGTGLGVRAGTGGACGRGGGETDADGVEAAAEGVEGVMALFEGDGDDFFAGGEGGDFWALGVVMGGGMGDADAAGGGGLVGSCIEGESMFTGGCKTRVPVERPAIGSFGNPLAARAPPTMLGSRAGGLLDFCLGLCLISPTSSVASGSASRKGSLLASL
mmetsp:Transcript_17338/g.42358  ORF Transcript_17338/g.42358 Transcript_17338/m.42358 type:complete len:255 (+) Transcript_17338:468-1232(+)